MNRNFKKIDELLDQEKCLCESIILKGHGFWNDQGIDCTDGHHSDPEALVPVFLSVQGDCKVMQSRTPSSWGDNTVATAMIEKRLKTRGIIIFNASVHRLCASFPEKGARH
ncbi:hypothetical protein ACJRO7_005870 [Eucalyptus globulus]|uniref:Uncharacterized protein n=1 Tax=Eucalyptus globulus TaxID=34317 RepID=A0ABD3J0M0_EUCGL